MSGRFWPVDGKDELPVAHSRDQHFAGLRRCVAFAMHRVLGDLEVLALSDLDLLAPIRTELKVMRPLRTYPIVTLSPWWCHPDMVTGAASTCPNQWPSPSNAARRVNPGVP